MIGYTSQSCVVEWAVPNHVVSNFAIVSGELLFNIMLLSVSEQRVAYLSHFQPDGASRIFSACEGVFATALDVVFENRAK